jgi:GTPase
VTEGEGGPRGERGRAVVVHPYLRRRSAMENAARTPDASLAEAVGLARAIDLEVVDSQVTALTKRNPSALLGGGAVDALAEKVEAHEATLVIIDHSVTPVQQRNLERALKCKVIDRTGLILEIFGARARTREGQLQVELAALSYQRSRLVRSWTHLERQRGGFGFLGGPGESQLEIDRRLIGDRIIRIKKELDEVRRTRGLHRTARAKVPYPVVALVGYTNAGKSTLFNRLAGADVFAKDLLFATLDPTMRQVTLPSGRKIILSDTVGFIADLPHDLVAAFRATLEEVDAADIILHVRDVSHPDAEAQAADVAKVLGEMDIDCAADPRVVEVLNKVDLLPEEEQAALTEACGRDPRRVALSAVTGRGIDALDRLLDLRMTANRQIYDLEVGGGDGAALAYLHAKGQVLSRADAEDGTTRLRVAIDPADLARFEKRFDAKVMAGG